jgi:tRNA-2-methylthio-N6-dimethylallyladenosine synthase
VEEHVKVERLKELNALVERKAKACSQRYLGRVEEVLAEGINPKDNTQLMGRTRTNRLTFFPAGSHRVGDTVPVRIEQVRAFSLSGSAQAQPALVR